MPKARRKCQHAKYPTSISAVKAAKSAGLKGQYREVVKCRMCQGWRIREGLL